MWQLPCRLVVVGAGYIGLEQSCIFNNLGSEVHLVVRQVSNPTPTLTPDPHPMAHALIQ